MISIRDLIVPTGGRATSQRMPERSGSVLIRPITDASSSEAAVALPRGPLAAGLAVPRLELRRLTAHLALALLVLCCAATVVFAAAGPTVLVWHSSIAFPNWLAGPLRGLLGRLPGGFEALSIGFSGVFAAMLVAYGLALRFARALSMRALWAFVLATSAILLLGPPLQATDIFNYIGYARLGALHGLNPYSHVIGAEAGDPVSLLATWHNWLSPYGPLYTALTYPLGLMPLAVAYWVLKAATVVVSVVFVWLVARCAKLAGRDPRVAVVFVAANPIFLLSEVGGFHNDVFMMVPLMAAIAFALSGRDRSAGAAAAAAIAVKFTAGLILPFLLLSAPSARRRARIVAGVALAAVPLLALSVTLFGTMLPNLADQSKILTAYSISNLLGWALGFGGGAPALLTGLELLVVAVLAIQLLRNKDWVAGAGWTTVALIVSLASLWPWYLIWLLPLAAIASSARLRAVALVLTAFLVLTTIPVTGQILAANGLNPMASPVGRAASATAFFHLRAPVSLRP